jgi:hypothetical protein
MRVSCKCGAVDVQLTGQALVQYYCHCDDCQSIHGRAYACALYPANAVVVTGNTQAVALKTTPRTKCTRCGTFLFAEVPGYGVRGVNALLFPEGAFVAEFHMQCQFAKTRITDDLPQFKNLPPQFGGSGEVM